MSLAKSVSKRIRITKNGKMLRRPMGVNHFKTRKTGRGIQNKRKMLSLDESLRSITNY